MAKYKYGDRVKYNGQCAKVGIIQKDGSGGYIYDLIMDDGTKQMVTENHLKPALNVSFKNASVKPPTSYSPVKHIDIKITIGKHGILEHCPICKNIYHTTEHPIHGKKEMWSDCLTCNKTKEQVENEKHEPKTISKEVASDFCDDFGFYD